MKRQDARHVRGIVDGLITRWEQRTAKRGNAVLDAWVAATDEKTRDHARPVSFKRGTLMVVVENSTWLYKLTLEKRALIEKFNGAYTGRKKAEDMRFRVGAVEE